MKQVTYNCPNGILIDSKHNMREMIVGIYADNSGDVKMKGLTNDDIIDIYE